MARSNRKRDRGGRPRSSHTGADNGTPEAIAKRAAIAALPRIDGKEASGDTQLTTCPLDIMLARGMVNREAYTAAMYWAAFHGLVFGSVHAHAVNLNPVGGTGESPETQYARAMHLGGEQALLRAGRPAFDAVMNVVIYRTPPLWMLNDAKGTADRRALGLGLAALLSWYQGREKEAA